MMSWLFFLSLFTFDSFASFKGLEFSGNVTLKKNGHIQYPARLYPRCEIKYYFREVCKISEIFIKTSAQKVITNENATKKSSDTREKIHFKRAEKEKDDETKVRDEFERLRRRDVQSRSKVRSAVEKICPYSSIRANSDAETSVDEGEATTCKTRELNESECEFTNEYFDKSYKISPRFCPRSRTTKALCWFAKKRRNSFQDTAELRCDTGICRDNAVFLGVFNTTLVQMMPERDWQKLVNGKELIEAIGKVMQNEYSNRFSLLTRCNFQIQTLISMKTVHNINFQANVKHFSFCFLRCGLDDEPGSITRQMLVFPPIVHNCTNNSTSRININIIVQDSVSRPQFYRSLPKTVTSLREIIHDITIDATVLDFEKYQSYGASTHQNVKKLFVGKNVDGKFADVSSAIKDMYKTFTKASYKTLFQEDACWFEGFGSLLRPYFLKDTLKNHTDTLWKGFDKYLRENLMPYIESFGVSFSSCKILQDLGDKNIFNWNKNPNLCFNGRPVSHYYLNEVENFFKIHKDNSCPVFSYLHLNTGHEHTGQRVTQDDEYLASFLRKMTKHHSTTLTILLSDHGSKTSDYAIRTVEGLKEIYKPFMFVIVPRQAAKILGNEKIKNLIRNQKRLVALEDLNIALDDIATSFVQENNEEHFESVLKVKPNRNGLFGVISAKRNCSEFNISANAVCQCIGEDVETVLDPFFLDFLARTGVGGLNNMIQFQYTSYSEALKNRAFPSEGNESGDTVRQTDIRDNLEYPNNMNRKKYNSDSLGWFGNCRRYILDRVERVRSKVVGNERVTTFSVLVNTIPAVKNRKEIFEMSLGHHLTKTDDIKLLKVTRLSRYSVFKSCADGRVQLELCSCEVNSKPDPENYTWELLHHYIFAKLSTVTKLEFSCLYLITTKRERFLKKGNGRNAILIYEIINACDNRIFNITVSEKSLVRMPFLLSRALPFSMVVFPNGAYHVISAHCDLPEGEFVPDFIVDLV